MTADIQRLVDFWVANTERFNQRFAETLRSGNSRLYQDMTADVLQARVASITARWLAALQAKQSADLIAFSRALGVERINNNVDAEETMYAQDVFRAQLWALLGELYVQGDWDLDLVHMLESWMHDMRSGFVASYSQGLHEAQERLAERERDLAAQGRIIQELSSPIVPIHEGVLVMPLVGTIDSYRAGQIMEAALDQIVATQAEFLILDITGVPMVDTSVANHLLQMTRAITLLGARVVLVGIGAEIAQMIVQLGLDMSTITTMANLQAGIAYVLAQHDLETGGGHGAAAR